MVKLTVSGKYLSSFSIDVSDSIRTNRLPSKTMFFFIYYTNSTVWFNYHQHIKCENRPMCACAWAKISLALGFLLSHLLLSVMLLFLYLSPNVLRGSEASTLRVISFAGLSFSVTDIGFDVILLLTVQWKKCSHEFMVLPMGGVCVIQQGSFYWLIPSSLVI